jgi:hypothetical protein
MLKHHPEAQKQRFLKIYGIIHNILGDCPYNLGEMPKNIGGV